MNTKKWLPVLVAGIFFLSTCSLPGIPDSENPGPILPETESYTDETAQQSSKSEWIPGVETVETPPAEGLVQSRLTNEWIDENRAKKRPIAVMIPNQSVALPQYGLSNASVLYEASVEGKMTRLLAIIDDWENLEKIGNVRSLRSYFAEWAFEWDAVLIHYGGPYMIDEVISRPHAQTINGTTYDSAYYRSEDRVSPHNAFTTGELILNAMNDLGYSREERGMLEKNHFHFASASQPNTLDQYGDKAVSASLIDMTGAYPLTRCYFEYNEEDGLYYRSQHLSGADDGPHVDGLTGKQLTFTNVLVQYTKQTDIGNGYLEIDCIDSNQEGWFFTRGKGIHVTWEKGSDLGATRFYDDNGYEVALNTGKTMICIIENGDVFSYK